MTPRFRARLAALTDLVVCALQGRDRIVLRALWGAAISPPGFPDRPPLPADWPPIAHEWLLSPHRLQLSPTDFRRLYLQDWDPSELEEVEDLKVAEAYVARGLVIIAVDRQSRPGAILIEAEASKPMPRHRAMDLGDSLQARFEQRYRGLRINVHVRESRPEGPRRTR